MRLCRDGSYIYEEFLPTQGTDVKVYAVGADYAHAGTARSIVSAFAVLCSVATCGAAPYR